MWYIKTIAQLGEYCRLQAPVAQNRSHNKKCEEQASNKVLSEYKIRFSITILLVNSVTCQSPSEELNREYRSSLRNRINVNYIFCYSPLFPAQYNLLTCAINVLFLSPVKILNSSKLRPHCLLSLFHFFFNFWRYLLLYWKCTLCVFDLSYGLLFIFHSQRQYRHASRYRINYNNLSFFF